MKKSYILGILTGALLLTGCSMEDPFGTGSSGSGRVLKSALDVTLNTDENVKVSRADDSAVSLDDFTVSFIQKNGAVAAEYIYSNMPDVVVLPEGEYKCTAYYGTNKVQDWNSPYYTGSSNEFSVLANSITSNIDPIECKLGNVKVSVTLDNVLQQGLAEEYYVNVKVNANEGLNFTKERIEAADAGYFQYSNELTLAATFWGQLDGQTITTTKSYSNIQPGSHYKLNFRLHDGDNTGTGGSQASVVVDTNVSVNSSSEGISPDDDTPIDVDPGEHPNEGKDDDPNVPDDPDTSIPPTIEGMPPVNLDGVNDGANLASCVVNVKSHADGGITAFTCKIESPTLTEEELIGMGLAANLDLVNPGDTAGPLTRLGFPVNVGGKKEVVVDITQFLGLLAALGTAQHDFILTVTDANGTTTKTLSIEYKE